MAWTEQDYQEIVARLMANSIGVNEVPNADKADDVTSLPAFKPSGSNSEASVVNYPLEFLKGEQGEPGIQGEPGKSFKVAGEYDTLEALKSAVPDGSAVDGFMAVGTEAPYDYYAWVNGEWVSQGKIGGIDEAPTDGKAYGRKNKDWVEVLEKSKTVEYKYDLREADLDTFKGSGGDIAFIGIQRNNKFATPENHYPLEEAGTLIVAGTITDKTNPIYHTYNSNRIFIRSATSSGENRDFSDWVEVAKVTDVLTKTNTSSFTPTGDYQPATKKYVDDKHIMLTITDEAHIQLISNQEVKAGEAESKINLVFGSIDNFKNIIQRLLSDNILFLKITEKEIFKVSTSHTYCNPDNGAYELSFIYTYTSIADANNIGLVTKRIFIALNSKATNFFVVKDILVSDNLTTLTKKTSDEYNNIASKDNETMYAITEA